MIAHHLNKYVAVAAIVEPMIHCLPGDIGSRCLANGPQSAQESRTPNRGSYLKRATFQTISPANRLLDPLLLGAPYDLFWLLRLRLCLPDLFQLCELI